MKRTVGLFSCHNSVLNLPDELIYNLRNEAAPLINSIYLEVLRDKSNTENIDASLSKQFKIIDIYDSFSKTKQKTVSS